MTGIDMLKQIDQYETSKIIQAPVSHELNEQNDEEQRNVDELRRAMEEIRDVGVPNAGEQRRPFKISLRSKAEEEIVNDAKRKKMMLELYEHKGPITDFSGYSVNALRGLRVLNLTACNRITDVSLKYSFQLAELREISLAKCQQITSDGMSNLIRNCPSLEIVNLSECHNINDKTIEMITIHLRRLTHFYLERCIHLTDHSLDYMAINCQYLRYLDVRGCRSMCSEPNLRLVNLTTLKHVSMSKPGPYVVDVITYKQPKPPPLPLAF